MTTAAAIAEMAEAYTAAWCSQDPARVASFFAEDGVLTINAGRPSVGREAIAASARAFMTAIPDLMVLLDALHVDGNSARYEWTLIGTNTGPAGTGRPVRIHGYEQWTFDDAGAIGTSLGFFDSDDYARQLASPN